MPRRVEGCAAPRGTAHSCCDRETRRGIPAAFDGLEIAGRASYAVARAGMLVRDPKILLLDEPFDGLEPIIVRDLLATCRTLAEAGQTILVVEQNISAARTLVDRIYVLDNGHMGEELAAPGVRAARSAVPAPGGAK